MGSWNERFSQEAYVFGTEPAGFLKAHAAAIPKGASVLCVADGEGRNSVYLAELGYRVTAFDSAPAALEKARALARARGVEVAFHEAGIEGWDWSQRFDAVVGVFIQFVGPPEKARLLRYTGEAVADGGLVLLHGYHPRQRDEGYRSGGPGAVENLYTEAELRAIFDGFEVLEAREYDAELVEGEGHLGRSALVDFIARKR